MQASRRKNMAGHYAIPFWNAVSFQAQSVFSIRTSSPNFPDLESVNLLSC
jgi:hypothetical protein